MTTTTDPYGGQADTPPRRSPDSPSAATAGHGSADGPALCITDQPLGLTVAHPAVGVCVVAVHGELDLLTAPLLDTCIREALAAAPRHLVLDLQPVRFLGSRGLACLLAARELAQQTSGTQLHLAGLVTRVVALPLEVTGLSELFDTYPTLTHALQRV
ncbi:MAG: STAS domain-containing protein [Pseudonocardiaceae bacterium]